MVRLISIQILRAAAQGLRVLALGAPVQVPHHDRCRSLRGRYTVLDQRKERKVSYSPYKPRRNIGFSISFLLEVLALQRLFASLRERNIPGAS
jgi:hypothetical protein